MLNVYIYIHTHTHTHTNPKYKNEMDVLTYHICVCINIFHICTHIYRER